MSEVAQGLNFGPLLLVQITVSVMIVLGSAFAYFRGSRASRSHDQANGADYTRLMLMTPISQASDSLLGLYRLMQQMINDNEQTVAEFRERHEREMELLRRIADRLGELCTLLARPRR